MRVHGELHERLGRGAEPPIVPVVLVTAYERPQRLRQGQDDRKGRAWKACLPPFCQPGLGGLVVAFRAAAVATGVVERVLLPPVVARQQMPTSGLGAAVDHLV